MNTKYRLNLNLQAHRLKKSETSQTYGGGAKLFSVVPKYLKDKSPHYIFC